jgi:hypothetical protein
MGVRRAVVVDAVGLKGVLLSVISPSNASATTVRGGLRQLLVSGAVLVGGVAGLWSPAFVSLAVAADTCPNGAARAQTGSAELPDCRAYEMVTPPYKEGFPVEGSYLHFNDDGVFSYQSRGAFAGNVQGSISNLYHAVRSARGWMTSSLDPSSAIYDTGATAIIAEPVITESPDLRLSLWRMARRDDPDASSGYWLRGPDGAFARVGDVIIPGAPDALGIRGTSDNLSHAVFSYGISGVDTTLHEYVGVNNGSPRLASIDNAGVRTPGETCLGSVSSDGRVIVFSSGCNGTGIEQIWARIGASATVAVSASECTRSVSDDGGLCNGMSAAEYAGAAVDGSRVFFTTSQQLVNGDVDATEDLYACDVPAGVPVPIGPANACSSLTEVSGARTGADVQSVVAMSDDGSRAYFVARGVLADNVSSEDVEPRAGDDNLYVWERNAANPDGQTRFITKLAVANDLTRVQLTPDGRYLLFRTANSLVADEAPGDDKATDVYRYDALTHQMERLSTSVAGGGGNGAGYDASIPGTKAMSADGSTVIFESAEALSLRDSNGVTDVYSWRDGQVSLISTGGGTAVGVSASGRDIFFMTDAPVLAVDRDINRDIYDARLGGGYELAPVQPSCSGESCRNSRSQAPVLPAPVGAGPVGGPAPEVVPTLSLRAVSAAQRRSLAATGKVTLTVTGNTPGAVSVGAATTIGGRSVTAGTARKTMAVAGRVAVVLKLSKRARERLASRGRLAVRISVSHSKVALDRAVTLRLERRKVKRSVKRTSTPRVTSVGGRS